MIDDDAHMVYLMKRSISILILFCVCYSLEGELLSAQPNYLSSRSMGMGGSGTAYISGNEASRYNPANLLLQTGDPKISIALPGGGNLSGGGSLLNTGVYQKYLTSGKTLAGTTAQNFLSDWFGPEWGSRREIGMHMNLTSLAISTRMKSWGWAMTSRTRMDGKLEVGRGVGELGIYGLDGGYFENFRPIDFRMDAHVYHEISGAVAAELVNVDHAGKLKHLRLLVGIAPKILLANSSTSADITSDLMVRGDSLLTHDFHYEIQTTGSSTKELQAYESAKAQHTLDGRNIADFLQGPNQLNVSQVRGIGYGVDAGITLEMDLPHTGLSYIDQATQKKLRLAVAITDWGRVNYSDEVGQFEASGTFVWKGVQVDQQKLDEEYQGDYQSYVENVLVDSLLEGTYTDFKSIDIDKLTRPLPTRTTFGLQLQVDRFALATDIGIGFNDVGMNATQPSFAIGAEYEFLGCIPFRLGFRTLDGQALRYSFGTGLNFRHFTFDVGIMSSRYGANGGGGMGVAWSGIQIRF